VGARDKSKFTAHLAAKVTFPATKDQIVESFEDTPDFSSEEIKFVRETLSPGSYASADAVAKALGL
jgi:hypothetical protein